MGLSVRFAAQAERKHVEKVEAKGDIIATREEMVKNHNLRACSYNLDH